MQSQSDQKAVCGLVVDYVINQIAEKVYAVGDKLPPERDLAKTLNVSRATVREAIKVLNYLGFVDSNQGSGNYITDNYDKTTANIMRVMFHKGDVDLQDFTEFRQMLELQSFQLAIQYVDNDQLHEMKKIVDLLDITDNSDLIFSLDNRLHTLLAEASHNRLIIINFYALSRVLEEYMNITYNKNVSKKADGFKRLQEYHHQIVNALINRDLEAGKEAIINHFKWASK